MIRSLRFSAISLLLLLFGLEAFAQAGFTFSPANGGCSPLVVYFTNTSGTGYNTSYQWNFGNSVTSTQTNPSVSYTSPGTYNITLRATGSSGTQTVTKSIVVYPPPQVSFTVTSTAGCAPLLATFSSQVVANASGRVRYSWDFGDGNTDTTAAPSHIYVTGGVYTVTLTATNSMGCSQTFVQTNAVTVYPKPAANFSAVSPLLCSIPAYAQFLATATGSSPFSYTWNYGDGTGPGNGSSPTHTYTSSGNFTVTLYTTDSRGCKDTLVKQSYIETHPNTATFSSPTMGCDSSEVRVFNTTTGGSQTEWLFGDGSFPQYGDTTGHVYTAPGVYTIRMVTTVGPCSDTVRHSILINPKPVANFTYDRPCFPGRMKFTGSSSVPGGTYTWNWANGGLGGSGDTISRPYASGGFYDTVTVYYTTAAGCRDTVKSDVNIMDLVVELDTTSAFTGCTPLKVFMIPFAGTSEPCRSLSFPISPYCRYPFPIVSQTWVIDGTITYTNDTLRHTFTTPGGHMIRVTITTANGCTAYRDYPIAVGDTIPPRFQALKDSACVGELVGFRNLTGISTIQYNWNFNNEHEPVANTYDGKHGFIWPGSKTVTLYSDFNGCLDTLEMPNAVYIRPGNAQWIDSVYCSPSKTVYLKDTSIGATSHLWIFGDGTPSVTTRSAIHTYANYGKYRVTKITYSSISGCRDTVADTVVIMPLGLDLIARDTTLCMRDTLHLTPVWQSAYPVNDWYIRVDGAKYDPGNPFKMPSPIDTVILRPGYDSVVFYLATRNNMCKDSIVKNRYIIRSQPVAGFKAGPVVGCMPMMVTFTDTTSYTPGTQPYSRWWSFGDGDTVLNNQQVTQQYYDTAGLFTVKLRVTDWIGCKDSITKRQYIDVRRPYVNFNTNKQAACRYGPINFNNLSSGATLLNVKWYFGDGDSSMQFHVTHAYRDTGTYTVRLIVWDSTGCRDTMTRPAYIRISSPKASFTLSDTIAVCPPLTVQFTSTSTGANRYNWTFGSSGIAVLPNPVSTFSAAGIHNVRLIAIDGAGCTDTAYAKVRVLGYAGALSYPAALGCAPLTVNFASTIWNVPQLVYDFADGVTETATSTTTSHTYTNPGKYVPKLIFSDGKGCTSASDGIDTIKVDGVEAGFKVVPPCEKTPLSIYDTSKSYFSPIVSSRWDFGPLGIVNGSPVSRTFPAAGDYPVTLISTNGNGCKDTLVTTLKIFPLPKVTVTADTAVCPPDAVALEAGGAKSYSWTPSSSLSCSNCDRPSANPTTPTNYIVTGTDSIGCKSTATVKIGVQAKATFKVSDGGTICIGESYQLSAGGATLYSWTPAQDLDSPDSRKPIARPKATTTYVVTGREGSCLPDTHQVRVVVRPVPVIDAGGEQKVVAGNMVILQASGTGIRNVSWQTDPSLSCHECFAPEARPLVTTMYKVTAFNEYGCKATDSVRVLVLCNGSQLFLPNTFTPDGDGQNDFFYPQGVGIERLNYFRIYSRWGELLYERKDMSINDQYAGWNGTHKGVKLSPDVYVYILEARCESGEPLVLKGDISIIR